MGVVTQHPQAYIPGQRRWPLRGRLPVLVIWVVASLVAAFDWRSLRNADFATPVFSVWKVVSGRYDGGGYADVDGVRIYYETYGAGPPVLLLHGGLGTLETMHNQIVDLSAHHLVIAADTRGHGRSTDGPGPMHYNDMADDMVGLLDHLSILRADVVGWSDGGIVGLDLAMRHPGRVRRLVAIGANTDPSGLSEAPGALGPDGHLIVPERPFAYAWQSPTPDQWKTFYAKMICLWRTEPRFTPAELARIAAPTLIVAGERDLIRRAHTDALTRAIPGAQEQIVAGAGHDLPLAKPSLLDPLIDGFISVESPD